MEIASQNEPVEVKNTNISKFELHEVAVDDDYTNGEDPKSSALYSLHLGNLFVVAKVPTLNFSIWYDKNNSDPWGPLSPHLHKRPFANMLTQDNMVFHGMQFGGRSYGYANATLPQTHYRSKQQFEDIQQVIYNFLFSKQKVPLYVKGPSLDQLPANARECMAQRVVSKMPPFHLVIQRNETDKEDELKPKSGSSDCDNKETSENEPSNFVINHVEFDGVKLIKNDDTGHVIMMMSNITLRLPFLFYGNLPPVMLDIYSHRDRWISINSPYSMKYTREDSLAQRPATPAIEIKLVYNMTKEGWREVYKRLNTFKKFSDLGLRIQGSQYGNAISSVMGGLNISIGGDEAGDAEEEVKTAPCDMSNNKEKRFGINASVASETSSHIDTSIHVKVPPLPVPFPIRFGMVNFTVMFNQSLETSTEFFLEPFVLGTNTAREEGFDINARVQIFANDGGVSYKCYWKIY